MLIILIKISTISRKDNKLTPINNPSVPPTLAMSSIGVTAGCSVILVYSMSALYIISRYKNDCCNDSKVTWVFGVMRFCTSSLAIRS